MPFTIPQALKHCTIPPQSTLPFLIHDATFPKGRTSPACFDSHVMSLPLLHIPNPPPCIYPTLSKPTLSLSSRPELAVQPSIMSCQSCLTIPHRCASSTKYNCRKMKPSLVRQFALQKPIGGVIQRSPV